MDEVTACEQTVTCEVSLGVYQRGAWKLMLCSEGSMLMMMMMWTVCVEKVHARCASRSAIIDVYQWDIEKAELMNERCAD